MIKVLFLIHELLILFIISWCLNRLGKTLENFRQFIKIVLADYIYPCLHSFYDAKAATSRGCCNINRGSGAAQGVMLWCSDAAMPAHIIANRACSSHSSPYSIHVYFMLELFIHARFPPSSTYVAARNSRGFFLEHS